MGIAGTKQTIRRHRLAAVALVAALGLVAGTASVTAAANPGNGLMVSANADMSSAAPLAHSSISGLVYIFIDTDAPVTQVSFYVDDPGGSGQPVATVAQSPWMLELDTSALTPGVHNAMASLQVNNRTSDLFARFNVQPASAPSTTAPAAPTTTPAAPATATPPATNTGVAALQVSANGRYLQYPSGEPFFYMGDTAWEMFHRLSREEAATYLDTRAQQGFTVIQSVALAELDGLTAPTPAGHLPLLNQDPATPDVKEGPDNDYWDDMEYMIDYANSKGMYVAIWVAWGSMAHDGPNVLNATNGQAYGEFIGQRFGSKNVLWVLGGDRDVAGNNTAETWGAVAQGISATDLNGHLTSYHPWGEQASTVMFPNSDATIDFNQVHSGHKDRTLTDIAAQLTAEYNQTPVKPVFDSEPRYENHPINWEPANGWFGAIDARQAAYTQVFSGAFGHTYGNHSVWQMWKEGLPDMGRNPRGSWMEAINHEGAVHMGHLRTLMTSKTGADYFDRVPDQTLVTSGTAFATRSSSGSYAFIYLPEGGSVGVDTSQLTATGASWFDPRTGQSQPATGSGTYAAPTADDWVLVIE
jgi:hypothetical protein